MLQLSRRLSDNKLAPVKEENGEASNLFDSLLLDWRGSKEISRARHEIGVPVQDFLPAHDLNSDSSKSMPHAQEIVSFLWATSTSVVLVPSSTSTFGIPIALRVSVLHTMRNQSCNR